MFKKIKSWLWWRSYKKYKRKSIILALMRVLYFACPYYEEEGKLYYISSEKPACTDAFMKLGDLGVAKAKHVWGKVDLTSWELLFDKLKEL